MKKISSKDNLLIKEVISLKKNRERRKKALFFIDGAREIGLAILAQEKLKHLFFCSNLAKKNKESQEFLNENKDLEKIEVTEDVFLKIAYKENPDGILAVFEEKAKKINDFLEIFQKKDSLILVLDDLEKPGNFGAIVRTAVAGGVDLIVLSGENNVFDIYNPNAIKASEGLVFLTNIIQVSRSEIIQKLKDSKIEIISSFTSASKNYDKVNYLKSSAIVLGSEAFGLGSDWQNNSSERIKIPMKDGVDSLNVSVSAAIVLYEALRQRGFQGLK